MAGNSNSLGNESSGGLVKPSIPPTISPLNSANVPKPLGNVPFTKAEQRKKLFKDAGITKQQLAAMTRKAVQKLDEALDANQKTYASSKGEFTDERSDPDHTARSKAAVTILELVDAFPSKQEGLLPAKVRVEVTLPDWAQPRKAIDVKSVPVSSGA